MSAEEISLALELEGISSCSLISSIFVNPSTIWAILSPQLVRIKSRLYFVSSTTSCSKAVATISSSLEKCAVIEATKIG